MSKIITTLDPTIKYTAHQILQDDGVIVIPTDTIYGISARYDRGSAIEKIYAIKKRQKEKALPILIGDLDQLKLVVKEIPAHARKLIEEFWPGGLTIVLKKQTYLPANLSEYESIGIRMPDHKFTLDLLRFCGPLATTSANISGGTNPTNILDVLMQFKTGIDLFIDGGRTAGDLPSTVVDCTSPDVKILREGIIAAEKILEVVNK